MFWHEEEAFLNVLKIIGQVFTDITCLMCWQEEEALLNEMEVTGQAFEDMQEQNIRLLQQLREKDDANFKLMSEVNTEHNSSTSDKINDLA